MIAVRGRLPPPRLDLLVRDIETALLSNDRARQSELIIRSAEALTRRWSRLPPTDKPGFDRLLANLLDQVDEPARAAFARQLTPLRRAPRATTTRLASDASLKVAAPLLTDCPSFDEEWLIEMIDGLGDAHRALIAQRPNISPRVAETLLRRGNVLVALALAANNAVALSPSSFATLVDLAETSKPVLLSLAARNDLSERDRATLAGFARARALLRIATSGKVSEAKAVSLLAVVGDTFATCVDPDLVARYAAAVEAAARGRGRKPVPTSRLAVWLGLNRIEDVLATLASDADLPVSILIACRQASKPHALAVILRGLGHPWSLLKALLQPDRGRSRSPEVMSIAYRVHTDLRPASARSVARFAAIQRGGSAFLQADDEGPPLSG